MVTYIVVWATKDEGWFEGSDLVTDHWSKHDSRRGAVKHYSSLLSAYPIGGVDLYSATVTVGLASTDYECSYANELDDCATDPRYWQCDCEEHSIKDKHVVLHCDECGMDEDEQPDARLTDIVDLFHSISRRLEDVEELRRQCYGVKGSFLEVHSDGGIGGGRP
tara:strand:- start:303 stop:794 length:492 start_codon:yes stop_codon:yes gene_type:complete